MHPKPPDKDVKLENAKDIAREREPTKNVGGSAPDETDRDPGFCVCGISLKKGGNERK